MSDELRVKFGNDGFAQAVREAKEYQAALKVAALSATDMEKGVKKLSEEQLKLVEAFRKNREETKASAESAVEAGKKAAQAKQQEAEATKRGIAIEKEFVEEFKKRNEASKVAEQRSRDLNKAQKELHDTTTGFFAQMKQGAQALVTIVGLFGAAAIGAGKLASTIAEGAVANEKHQRALAGLGSSWALVQQATRGAVSAEDAFKAQQTLTQSGLRITGNDLALITRAAREYALATGTETTQAIEQMTDALRGGESEGLRRFGLTADSTGNRVRGLHSAMDQLQARFRGTQPSAQSLGETVEQVGRQWNEFKNATMAAAAETLHLKEIFGSLIEMMQRAQQDGLFVAVGEQVARLFDPTGVAENRARAAAHTAEMRSRQASIDASNRESNTSFRTQVGQTIGAFNTNDATRRAFTEALEGRNYDIAQRQQITDAIERSASFGGNLQDSYNLITRLNSSVSLDPAVAARREQTQRRAEEQAEYRRMRQVESEREAYNAARVDPAQIRELGRQLSQMVEQAGSLSQDRTFGINTVSQGRGESLLHVLSRQTTEFESHLRSSYNRVERHRGETMDAFLQRRIQVMQQELQLVVENERGKREAIDATIELEKEQLRLGDLNKQQVAQELEITRRTRRGQAFGLIRGLGERATTAGLTRDAEGALGLNGFNPGGQDQGVNRAAILGRIGRLGEQAANAQDEHTAEQLQAQAQALAEVVGRYDELQRAQVQANDTSFQFAQAFNQHTELVSTSAQTMSSVASEAFGTFKGALKQHIGAVIAGKESIGEALRQITIATLTNLAERSAYEAIWETGKALGSLAMQDYRGAGLHFAAAGAYAGLAVVGGVAANALNNSGQGAAQAAGGASGYVERPNAPISGSPDRGTGTTVVNLNFNGAVMGTDNPERMNRWIADHVNLGLAEGRINRRTGT